MENELKQYKKASAKVARIEAEIENARTLPFYDKFGGEAKRLSDIATLRAELREAISIKMSANQSLVQALNLDYFEDNTQLREITLSKAS